MATITADLVDSLRVEVRDERDHVWIADEPTDVGGNDTGPTPYELLLSALAACTLITLRIVADREEIPLDSVSAKFTYDRIHADDCTNCDDDVTGFDDHMGWQDQGDGKLSYGLNIENGRLYDDDHRQLKAMMREICHTFGTELRMTGHQSIIVTDIAPGDQTKLTDILNKHNVPSTEQTSTVRRWSMACVALPTCGLAITESERRLPSLVDDLEQPLAKLGLDKERFTIRMTGCPNGCARPYNAEVGLVGKAKGKYTMFLGGSTLGHRLNWIYKDMVPADDAPTEIGKALSHFKANRTDGESFGDFCDREGKDALLAACGE